MSDLFKPQQDKLQKAKVSQSLSILDKLKQMKAARSNVLLIDVSGSMAEEVSEMKSKDEHVREILKKLPEGLTTYAFNSYCRRFKDGILPEPSGGTNMSGAFMVMKQNDHYEIVLITDGMPDNSERALLEAQGMKIDIIYIGPEPMPQFLKDLAKKTSGNFTSVDMVAEGASALLENKIKGFLK